MRNDSLVQRLAPVEARCFTGQRWANILFRCLHLVGLAGIAGTFLYDAVTPELYWQIAFGSGVALVLLQVWSSALWLVQLKGLVILCKLLLLAIAAWCPAWRPELFIAVLLLSGLIAHAPGAVRGYRIFGIRRSAAR